MLKKFVAAILVGTSLLSVGCGSVVEQVEETGQRAQQEQVKEEVVEEVIEEAEVEKKIVTATVSATQVMDRLGIDLVGVPTTSTTLPERYTGVPEVGQAFSPNFEVIASLTPDLLIFDINFKEKVEEQVNQYGMNAYYFDTTTFTNFKGSIVELGELVNKKDEAEKLVSEIQESVEAVLSKATKSESKPKVAIVFGTAESYMLATDTSYVGDLLNTIGVDNITDEIDTVDSAYLNFSMEQVLEMNPDYILRLAHGDLEASKKAFDEEFATNPAWMALDATKEGRVYDLDPALFAVTANLSVVNAITELGNIIYGE